ncbi:MAG: hypothetical protein A4E62_02107 [Syntrophorhabdus sp. PtaU1.Bin002]|nr:MAG: hypothetical protein A4E62_02107 [Syntrophorhabdus sp. PtaU1.Bin002]
MSRIIKHDLHEVGRGARSDDPPLKSARNKLRYKARMVEVGVGEEKIINFTRIKCKRGLVHLVAVPALVHSAVDENLCIICREMKA